MFVMKINSDPVPPSSLNWITPILSQLVSQLSPPFFSDSIIHLSSRAISCPSTHTHIYTKTTHFVLLSISSQCLSNHHKEVQILHGSQRLPMALHSSSAFSLVQPLSSFTEYFSIPHKFLLASWFLQMLFPLLETILRHSALFCVLSSTSLLLGLGSVLQFLNSQ